MGKLWRLWTDRKDFPRGFGHCELALEAKIFEASHRYRLKGQDQYLTIIEETGDATIKPTWPTAWTAMVTSRRYHRETVCRSGPIFGPPRAWSPGPTMSATVN